MPVTVANEDGVVMVESSEEAADLSHRFHWSAVFAGAAIAIASIFFLLSLGAGVGLSLVSAKGVAEPRFLTLGAIYFLAAQAFGLAIGGHVTGRLIGPAPESAAEEEFRAAAHGLVVWALAVIVTAFVAIVSGWVAAGSAANMAAISGGANATTESVTPAVATYWADMLFRPMAGDQHASIGLIRYAQADTGTQTDADQNQTQVQPMQSVPSNSAPSSAPTTPPAPPAPAAPSTGEVTQPITPRRNPVIEIPPNGQASSDETANSVTPEKPRDIVADKAEVARILEVGMANGGTLSAYDKQRIASLIAADTDASAQASRRVDDAVATIRADEQRTAEFARRTARNASLWIAFALLFGAIVTAMATISARWTDDRKVLGRREPG